MSFAEAMRRAGLPIAALACVLASRADAQRIADVAPGSRVRIAVVATFGLASYAAADDSDERRENLAIVGGAAVVAAIIGAVRPYERWRRVR